MEEITMDTEEYKYTLLVGNGAYFANFNFTIIVYIIYTPQKIGATFWIFKYIPDAFLNLFAIDFG